MFRALISMPKVLARLEKSVCICNFGSKPTHFQ